MHPARTHAFIAVLTLVAASMSATLPLGAAQAAAERQPARHFALVNATFDSVIALAVAPAGSQAFHDIALGEPLHGGLTAITVDLPRGGCLRAMRVTFRDGRILLYPRIDVCRHDGLSLRLQGNGAGSSAPVPAQQ